MIKPLACLFALFLVFFSIRNALAARVARPVAASINTALLSYLECSSYCLF
jgi:hypothetical protein